MHSPIRSFWMGGYEGADHVNGAGRALDMVAESGHLAQLAADHARAAERGIRTVRESIGWRLAEPSPGHHDLSRAIDIARSAQRHGLQVVWTLMHYGTPPDLSLLDDALCERFARFAAAVAKALAPYQAEPPVYNPINEISFVAWAVSQTNMFHPYRGDPADGGQHGHALGYDVKKRLVRATLMAVDAIREVDPRARFLHVEPLVHVAPPFGRPDLAQQATASGDYQWQTWDMLCGRSEPQLGGSLAALDLVGANHYHNSQWEWPSAERLSWRKRDARRVPLSMLLQAAWQRYGRPLLLAETSHVGDGRAAWLDDAASEVAIARAEGVPVIGLCLYPLVDRADWANAHHWHRSGLWDVAEAEPPVADTPEEPRLRRVLCDDYAEALSRWQAALPERASPGEDKPWLIVFSHLRWNFVWHRPQQLMTRLCADHRVLFVEEPRDANGSAVRLDRQSRGPSIDVLVPHLDGPHDGFDDAACARIAPLLAAFIAAKRIERPIVWFYAPMALPLLEGLDARAVVYDCIDELAGFINSPPELRDRERALMRRADIVLCSGPSLAAAKSPSCRELHLLPNGVDAMKFAPHALDAHSHDGREAALLQRAIATPRLGYAGVIDERLDLRLIEALVTRHPDWHFVFVGPVSKIDAAALPRRANVHWLGLQPYARLPHLFAEWDVCLLPFADNAVTRLCNPAKLLEYIAAGKPIVSTGVPDAIALHGDRLRWAVDIDGFDAACIAALQENAATRSMRIERAREPSPLKSWDDCAKHALALLAGCVNRSATEVAPRLNLPRPA